ncbi:MAG: histidine kinase, partial [Weeksellaceae bacterium]
ENLQKDEMVQSQEEKIRTHKMFTIALIGFALLVLLSLLLHYRTSKLKNKAVQSLHEKQEELLKEKYEKSLVQAEMLASRSQLNPHFLFNCFTGIHLLIQKGEYKKADQYLILLSRFVRMILELPKSHSISLNEELKLIKYYVSLEEKRFNGEFQFNLETLSEEEMEDIEIPPLLLQPFVENAIWHGLLPSEKQIKKLDIQITRSDSDIRIVIEDNGVGRGVQSKVHIAEIKEGKKSMGMKITKDRIIQFNKSSKSKIKFQVIDKMDENSGQSTGTKVVLVLSNCLNDK